MIGTLDSQVIEKFKEFQTETNQYNDLNIEDVEFDKKTISDVIDEFIKGSTPKYSSISTNTIVIKSGQARGNYNVFDFKNTAYLDLTKVKNPKYLQKGDILINTTGVGTAGRVTLFDLDGGYVSDSHITALRYDLNSFNKFYLLHFFVNYGFKKLEAMAEGSGGQVELSMDKIKPLVIPVPKDYNEKCKSIDIQKAIVEFLEFWKINYTDVFRQTVTHQKPILEKIKKALIPATFRHDKTIVKSFNEFTKSNNYKIKLEEVTFKKIDFFNIKKNDLLSPKKLEKNQDLILQNSSNNGYPVYSGAIEQLCKVDESKYPNKIFVPNYQNPDISFANNGDGSAGRNFFVHTDKYFVNQERTVISFKNDNDFYSLYILNQIINMRDKYSMNRENRPTPKDLPKFGIEITLPSHNTLSSFDIQKILVEFWEMILNNMDERFTKFDNIERLTDKVDEAFLYRTFSKIEWR